MRNYDLEFLKRFSMVIALLATITLGLILLAAYIHTRIPPEVSPTAAKRTEQRISPTGAVYASTGAAARRRPRPPRWPRRRRRYGGTKDGKVIFDNLCTACHTNGVGMAPTLDHSHWDKRIAQGKDTLYKHAIEGYTGPDGDHAQGRQPADRRTDPRYRGLDAGHLK